MAGLVFNIVWLKPSRQANANHTLEDKTTRMDIVLFPDDAEL